MGNINPTNQVTNRDDHGRFLPGISGNPGGRPPAILTHKAREILSEVRGNTTRAELFVRKVIDDAFNGDASARRLIWEYVDGKAPDRLEVEGHIKHMITQGDVLRILEGEVDNDSNNSTDS